MSATLTPGPFHFFRTQSSFLGKELACTELNLKITQPLRVQLVCASAARVLHKIGSPQNLEILRSIVEVVATNESVSHSVGFF